MLENELDKREKQKEPSNDWRLGFRSLRTVNYGRDLLERAKASARIDRKQDCPLGKEGISEKNLKHVNPMLKTSDDTPRSPVVEQAESVLTALSEASVTPVAPSTKPASVPHHSEEQFSNENEAFGGQKKRLSNVQSLIESFEYSKRPEDEIPKTTSLLPAKRQNRIESEQKTEEHHAVETDEPFLFPINPESYPIRKISNDQPYIESSVERVKYEVLQFPEEAFIRLPEDSGSDDSTTDSSDEETDSEDDTELTYIDPPVTPVDEPKNLSFVGSAPMSEDEDEDNWDVSQNCEETGNTVEDSSHQIDSSPDGCSPNSKISETDDHPNVLYVRVVPPDPVLMREFDNEKVAMGAAESILKIRAESRDQLSSEDETDSVSHQSSVTEASNTSEKYQEDTVASESSMKNTSPSTNNMNESDEVHELEERSEENIVSSNSNKSDRKADSPVSSEKHPHMSSDVSAKSENTVDEEEYQYQVDLFLQQIKEKSIQMLPQPVVKESERIEAEKELSVGVDHDHCYAALIGPTDCFGDCLCTEKVTESPTESSHSSENIEDESEESQQSAFEIGDFSKISNGLEVDHAQEYSIDLPSSDKVLKSMSPVESVEENEDESRSCSEKDQSTEESLAETPENIAEKSIEEDFAIVEFREPLNEFDENIDKLYGTIQESRLPEHQEDCLLEDLNSSAKAENSIPNAELPTASSEETSDLRSDSSQKDESTFPISASSYLAPALHLNTKRMFATSRTPENEEIEDEYSTSDDYETPETTSMDSLPEYNDSECSPPPRKLGIQLTTQDEKDSVNEACEEEIGARFAAIGFIPLPDYSEDSDTSLDSSEDLEEKSEEMPTLPEDSGENPKQIPFPESTLAQNSGDNVQLEIQRRLEESLAQPRTTFEVAPIVEKRLKDKLNPKDGTQSKIQTEMTTTLDVRRKHFEPVRQAHTSGKTSEQKLLPTKKLYVYKSSSSKAPVLPADIFKERPSSEEWESYYEDDSKSEQPVDYYQAPVSESHSHGDPRLTTGDLLHYVEQEDVLDECLENDGKSRFYFLIAKINNQGFGEKLLMSCLPTLLARVFDDNDICYFGPDAKGKNNQMRALKLVVESQTACMNATRPEHMRADVTAFHQDLARVDILDSINRIENIKIFSDENKKLLVDAVLQIEHYQADKLVLACQGAPKNVSRKETDVDQQNYFGECFEQYDHMLPDIPTMEYSYQDEPMAMKTAPECFLPSLLVDGRYQYAPVEWMRQPTEYINNETILSRPNSVVHHVSMEPVEQETYAAQSSEAKYFIQNNNMLYETYLEKQRMNQSIETTHTHPIEESLFLYQSGCKDQHGIPTMVMNASMECNNTSTVLENWSRFQSYCALNRGFWNNSVPTYFLNVSMPNHQSGGAAPF